MRRFWYIFIVLIVFSMPSFAGSDSQDEVPDRWRPVINNPNDPNEFIKARWEAVVKVLKAEKLKEDRKASLVEAIVTPIFDLPLMSKLALGRKHWSELSKQQRKDFTDAFVGCLKSNYRKKITLYEGQQAEFDLVKRTKKTVRIEMTLKTDDSNISVLYKLHKNRNKAWRVYDVEIEGVSIILTYRSQFDDILQNGTIRDVISRLRELPDC